MMSWSERARRRGALAERAFLDEMKSLGFCVSLHHPPDLLWSFRHPDTPGVVYGVKYGQAYASALPRLREELALAREAVTHV